MKGFIELFQAPPPWLRMPNKRGTFFWLLDPGRAPLKALPKLLSECVGPSLQELAFGQPAFC